MLIVWFVLGGLVLLAFLAVLRAFERASVKDIKSLGAWLAALAGLSLALLMFLTGRGGAAISGLLLFGPLLWQHWQRVRLNRPTTGRTGNGGSGPRRGTSGMSRDEAYEILGLRPGASEADIRAAHRRLMRAAHPDGGGSDWVASRVNQARDVLLG